MKKRILLLTICLALFSANAYAQFSFGLTAGMNFMEARLKDVSADSKVGYVLGLTGSWDLPAGFSLQPSVLFNTKDAYFTDSFALNMSYLDIPLSLQWGPDLMIFRPFVDVTPYIGLHLKNKGRVTSAGQQIIDSPYVDELQSFEYGLGLGGGIDVWRLRLILRYNWNFGPIFTDEVRSHVLDHKGDNYCGLTLALSFFLF